MPHRFIRQFLNNERIIQQMADSSLMRQAARLFVSGLFRARGAIEDSTVSRRLSVFSNTFKDEFKKGLK
uniref:TetR_C_7 domain-containing protein n=1 Tax=Panagrellus redivivus TaxID=6233 RepID=A0A7E4V1Z7_PANRE